MSQKVTPRFLPWLRTGLAAHISEQANNGIAPGDTASIAVVVQLKTGGGTSDTNEPVPAPSVRLRGPGEVIGIDQSLITRREPEPGETDAERNYFALVEFSDPDFPWRYTPARPADNSPNRLQPWIVLVVVEEREGIQLETGGRLPILHVDDVERELPDLEQCWAWAHVHASHNLADGIGSALEESPGAFRARLMCPRFLSPNKPWIACVVPAFKAGVRAGLGQPVIANEGLAWNRQSDSTISLPVYHYWRFRTGPKGDFESLVRRLKARELPETVGRRDLDISRPGSGLNSREKVVISYQGALISPEGQPRPWPEQHRREFKDKARSLLNAEFTRKQPEQNYDALRDDPVVGPPTYANRQAQRRAVPKQGEKPEWFEALNTEPQHRAAAGLGTEVVRRDQEALMDSAWQYAASAPEASRILTRARTAEEVGKRVKLRFDSLPDEALIQIAGPAMARLRHSSGKTVLGAANDSALPGGLISGTFRRLSHAVPGLKQAAPTGRVPLTGAVTQKALSDPVNFVAKWATVHSPANADVENEPQSARITRALPSARIAVNIDITPRIEDAVVPYSGNIQLAGSLVSESRAALNPQATIHAMLNSRILNLSLETDRPVPDRVFVRPRFTTPMYERLAALSAEYLVPGIGEIRNDTLGLLITNPPFVEAYMAGLNHEMGREFLWREYPARLSDTWFQYFWNGGAQAAADIQVIRNWQDANGLGENAPKGAPQAGLVLLIRSPLLRRYPEMRVYAVEAEWRRVKKDGVERDVRREAENGDVKKPLFTARLTADITVFGFEMDVDLARGSKLPEKHPGYFFVLEQPAGAPRFGLDEKLRKERKNDLAAWTKLSWSDLEDEEGKIPSFVDVNSPASLKNAGPLPTNSDEQGAKDAWGADAAAMARITYQRPVRMLVHADSMLPDAPPLPKDRDPKDGDPKGGGPKDGGPKDGGPKDGGPIDRDPRDTGPKDRDPRDRRPRGGGPINRGPIARGPRNPNVKDRTW